MQTQYSSWLYRQQQGFSSRSALQSNRPIHLALRNWVAGERAGSMGRPQLGLPRLLGIKVKPARQYYSAELMLGDLNDGKASSHKKGPGSSRGMDRFGFGVCVNQAVAVRNFLTAISSFARYQSSSSWPFSLPLSS
jgi:hypothetical protein